MNPEGTDTGFPAAGIILAAGLSVRMGKSKLDLPFRGRPLVEHVIRAAAASILSPVIAVLGENAETLAAAADFSTALVVINPDSHTGRASSLIRGLAQVPQSHAGIMVLLGDQPLVTSGIIDTLAAAFQRYPGHWIAPVYKGRRGNPVIIPRRWFNHLRSLTGDSGPRKLLSCPGLRLHLVAIDDPAVLTDVDTIEDYKQLELLE
jgi:molybdenum cofactor cytidylyltransferase